MILTCREEFSAAHSLRIPDWSEAENLEVFGKSSGSQGHGHNYLVEVSLKGKVNPDTGMVVDLRELRHILKEVIRDLDHRNLNVEIPYFQSCLPTNENLALYFFEKVSGKVPVGKVEKVLVYEDENTWAEIRA